MSYFSNSIRYLVKSIIAPVHRLLSPWVDYLESIIWPMQQYFNDFAVLDEVQRIRARASGQIIVLRAYLEWLTGKTGITITVERRFGDQGALYLESETLEPKQYFYIESENTPYYFLLEGETEDAFSYTIGVPAPLTPQLEQLIRSEVDILGIPTQQYTIVEI